MRFAYQQPIDLGKKVGLKILEVKLLPASNTAQVTFQQEVEVDGAVNLLPPEARDVQLGIEDAQAIANIVGARAMQQGILVPAVPVEG